eukprot:1666320-Alexandrium_andersonii.AAC.1
MTPSLPGGSRRESLLADVQPGVAASGSRLRRRGPTRADCPRESPVGVDVRDPESQVPSGRA